MAQLSNSERQRERRAQMRMQKQVERKYTNRIRLIILESSKRMVAKYVASGEVGTVDALENAIFQTLKALWRDSLGVAGKRLLTRLKSSSDKLTLKFDIFSGDFGLDGESDTPSFEMFIQEFIDQHGGRKIAADISTETREQIVRQTTAGAVESLGSREVAASIVKRLPQISKFRALMIARTEVHGATNYAQDQVARSLGVPIEKEWIAADQPDRTRPSHQRASDGKPIPLDDLFQVGSDQLRYAGDPRGSAEEVINCRCAIGYVVDD